MSETVLVYGFALFFVFFALTVLIIRYSNKELLKNLVNLYEKMKNAEKDMRALAEAEMRGKQELKSEIEKLRTEIEALKPAKETQKAKVLAR